MLMKNTKYYSKYQYLYIDIHTEFETWDPPFFVFLTNFKVGSTMELFTHSLLNSSVADPVFLGHPNPDPEKYRIRILYP